LGSSWTPRLWPRVCRPSANVNLRGRDSQSVARDDLRLIREDLAAVGVHEHLQPMHVVGAILLVVTERLDARKVLDPPALGVKERLVDPEVVRVAVDVGAGFAKAITCSRRARRNSWKSSSWPSVSASVCGLRSGARVPSVRSQPGSACEMNMIAAEW
jgi:hypothetical protein